MTRVLIVTASYGSGHNVAARCLAAAFEREKVQVTVVDHFRELVHPLFDRSSRALYHALLRRAPFLWGLGYSFADWMASDSVLTLGVTRLGTRRLGTLLERLGPDLVVTVHATPAVAISTLARLGTPVPPHTTVVTDFVAHSQWIAPHIARYCVADPEVRHELIARGGRRVRRSSSRWRARRASSAACPTWPAPWPRCAGRSRGWSSPGTTRDSRRP